MGLTKMMMEMRMMMMMMNRMGMKMRTSCGWEVHLCGAEDYRLKDCWNNSRHLLQTVASFSFL